MVDGTEVIVETNEKVKKEIDSNSANIELSYLNQNGNKVWKRAVHLADSYRCRK